MPAEAWIGRRASIGRDLAGCRWVAAVAALDRLIDEAARPLRGSPSVATEPVSEAG